MLQHSNKREEQALFRSGTEDGIYWLFVIVRADGWAITRNGVNVASGTVERVSLTDGLQKFLSLTRSTAERAIAESPALPQRKKISRAGFWANQDVESQEKARPKAARRTSAPAPCAVAVS